MTEESNLSSIERRLDRLTDAVEKLVLIEERQTAQAARIGQLEARVSECESSQRVTDAKVDMWINRGIGAWALAATVFSVLKTFQVL